MTYKELGRSLGMSDSQAYTAVQRAVRSGLLGEDLSPKGHAIFVVIQAAKYVFPVQLGGIQRGVSTAHSASPLKERIAGNEEPIVWAFSEGSLRGATVEPIYKTAPMAAMCDPALHELLALIDAVRIGRSRERELAFEELRDRLEPGT